MNTYTTNFWDCSFPYGSGRQTNVVSKDNFYTLPDLSSSLFTQEETLYTIANGPPTKSDNSLFFINSYNNSNCQGDKWCGLCCNGTIQDNEKDVKLLSGNIAKNLIIGYSYNINLFHSNDIGLESNIYFGYCAVPTKYNTRPPSGNICDTLINDIEYGDILKLSSTINKDCPPIYLMAFDCCGTCMEGNYRSNLDIAIPVVDNGGAYTCLKKTIKDKKCNLTGCDEKCKESFCWAYDNTWSLNNSTYPTFENLWNSNDGHSLPLGDKCEYYPKLMQIGCNNWNTLQNTYFKDNPQYGLGKQNPAQESPIKAWTYEVIKSGTEEFSDIFYSYYFESFKKYYAETYTNLQAEKSGEYYTGRITSDINFFNPSASKTDIQVNTSDIKISDIHIKGNSLQVEYSGHAPSPDISKGCIMTNC